MKKKFLIIFFGIGRGGEVAKRFYEKKFDEGFSFFHAYLDQEYVQNKRSGESFNVRKARVLLSSDVLKINESDFQGLFEELSPEMLFDIYDDGLSSITNLLRQLFIIDQVCKNLPPGFDRFVFIRDDTVTDFNIEMLKRLDHWTEDRPRILLPISHWHGGVCDRFFVVNHTGLELFSKRLGHAVGMLFNKPISSESIFQNFLAEFGYVLSSCPVKVRRIRSGAHVIEDRYRFPFHRPNELLRIFAALVRFIFGR